MDAKLLGLGEAPVQYPRVIGRIRGDAPGSKTIIVGGLHGNERAGVVATRRVVDRLAEYGTQFCGDLIALSGNTRALAHGVRYLEKDLNRVWTPEIVSRVGEQDELESPEDLEQVDLLDAIRTEATSARGKVFFIDLHTSSAEGAPFVTIGDTLHNRKFALNFPLPVILGLEEQIDGALLEFMNNLGYTTIGFEAGQHESEDSHLHIEASLWLSLVHAGHLRAEEIAHYAEMYDVLNRARRGLPRIVEVRHRHIVRDGDRFRMRPGFTNFDRVKKGQPLADDKHGVITATESARVLLPLYQGQGNDGFFLCRRISPFWLRVSRVLRRMKLGNYIGLFPGVSQHPDRPDTLIIDTRVARLFPLQVFHLLGYRKLRRQGPVLLVTRRRFDELP